MINLCEKGRTEDEMVAAVKNCTPIKVALKKEELKKDKSSISKVSKDSKLWNVDDLESWM